MEAAFTWIGTMNFPGFDVGGFHGTQAETAAPVAETKATFLRCRAEPQESGLF